MLKLSDPTTIENPFYRLVPEALFVTDDYAGNGRDGNCEPGGDHRSPGASGDSARPPATILHIAASHVGQIYIPRVTVALLIGVLLLVGLFRTSSALASAYGIAVATTMVVDGLLALLRDLEALAMAIVASVFFDRAVCVCVWT